MEPRKENSVLQIQGIFFFSSFKMCQDSEPQGQALHRVALTFNPDSFAQPGIWICLANAQGWGRKP